MAELEIVDVEKTYRGRKDSGSLTALAGVSIRVEHNEFVVLLGPSGCGKSTLLRLVAGLEQADSGRIRFRGEPVRGPGHDRSMLFQDYALFPWRTVRQNVEFGPEVLGVPARVRREAALRYIEAVGLEGFTERYPHELSGGMKQRVAIARVLINDPGLVLMDEPFASLDVQTRATMQQQLLAIFTRQQKTILFVTHSVEEALVLADTVYVMTSRPGRIRSRVPVRLQRPRDPLRPEFIAMRRELLGLLDAAAPR